MVADDDSFAVAGAAEVGGVSYVGSVSYTHLDVYKRQALAEIRIPGAVIPAAKQPSAVT